MQSYHGKTEKELLCNLIKDSFWTIYYKGHYIDGHSLRSKITGKSWEDVIVTFRHDNDVDHYTHYPVKSVLAGKQLITKLIKEGQYGTSTHC